MRLVDFSVLMLAVGTFGASEKEYQPTPLQRYHAKQKVAPPSPLEAIKPGIHILPEEGGLISGYGKVNKAFKAHGRSESNFRARRLSKRQTRRRRRKKLNISRLVIHEIKGARNRASSMRSASDVLNERGKIIHRRNVERKRLRDCTVHKENSKINLKTGKPTGRDKRYVNQRRLKCNKPVLRRRRRRRRLRLHSIIKPFAIGDAEQEEVEIGNETNEVTDGFLAVSVTPNETNNKAFSNENEAFDIPDISNTVRRLRRNEKLVNTRRSQPEPLPRMLQRAVFGRSQENGSVSVPLDTHRLGESQNFNKLFNDAPMNEESATEKTGRTTDQPGRSTITGIKAFGQDKAKQTQGGNGAYRHNYHLKPENIPHKQQESFTFRPTIDPKYNNISKGINYVNTGKNEKTDTMGSALKSASLLQQNTRGGESGSGITGIRNSSGNYEYQGGNEAGAIKELIFDTVEGVEGFNKDSEQRNHSGKYPKHEQKEYRHGHRNDPQGTGILLGDKNTNRGKDITQRQYSSLQEETGRPSHKNRHSGGNLTAFTKSGVGGAKKVDYIEVSHKKLPLQQDLGVKRRSDSYAQSGLAQFQTEMNGSSFRRDQAGMPVFDEGTPKQIRGANKTETIGGSG